jgi:hypothetical protein
MTATTRTCGWCRKPTDSAVEVGIIEQATRPGAAIYACGPCVSTHRIKPLAEHVGGDGQPQYRTGTQPHP